MEVELAAAPLLSFLLASVRIVSWLLLVPPFSSRSVPPIAKIVLAFSLAFATQPAQMGRDVPVDTFGFASEVLIQVGIGVTLGFVTQMLISAVSSAGALIDVFGGFSLSTAYDPLALQSNTVFGKFYQQLAVMLLFVSGGYLVLIGGLIKTFEFLPVGAMPQVSQFSPESITVAFTTFFVIAVQLALPMIAVLILADIGLALLTKVSPQLNALGFMFPAKIGLVLLLVGVSFPALPDAIEKIVDLATQAASTFSGGDG